MAKRVNAGALECSITPGTVYISSNANQSSYANFTITLKNSGSDALNIQSIAITLPAGLAPPNALQSITPVAAQANSWTFQPSMINVGEYDAAPVSGTSVTMNAGITFSFELENVTLVNTITSTPQNVPVSVIFSDGSNFSQDLPVKLETATAEIVSFNATLSNILPGQTTTLNWQCTGIQYCILQPGDGTELPADHSGNVSPSSTTIYTLYAYGPGVILSAQFGVTVDAPQIISFGVAEGQTVVPLGGSVTLSWVCNAFTDRVSITSSTAITIPLNLPAQKGSVTLGPVNAPTTFTLYAYAKDKSYFTTWIAYVGINNVSVDLSASPSTGLWAQDTVALSWNITNATAVSLTPAVTNGPSLKNLSGTTDYTPAAGITGVTFTLSATGFINNTLQTISTNLTLNFQAVTITQFESMPPIAPAGVGGITLLWEAQAPNVQLDNASVPPVTSIPVNPVPPNGTIYTLTAGTGQNPAMVSKQVKVINVAGPYRFSSFDYVQTWYDPTHPVLIIPSADLIPMLPFIASTRVTVVLTGISLGGVPYNAPVLTTIGPGQQYGIAFIIKFNNALGKSFQWTDPNQPFGTVTIISTFSS